MQEPNGTGAPPETARKLLIGKAIVQVQVFSRYPMSDPMDLSTLKEQAERCRRLAKHADSFTQKRLLDLASEYEAKIAKLEPEPSAASRVVRTGQQ